MPWSCFSAQRYLSYDSAVKSSYYSLLQADLRPHYYPHIGNVILLLHFLTQFQSNRVSPMVTSRLNCLFNESVASISFFQFFSSLTFLNRPVIIAYKNYSQFILFQLLSILSIDFLRFFIFSAQCCCQLSVHLLSPLMRVVMPAWKLIIGYVKNVARATSFPSRYCSLLFHDSLFDFQECDGCIEPAPARVKASAIASKGLRLRPLVAAARQVNANHYITFFYSLLYFFKIIMLVTHTIFIFYIVMFRVYNYYSLCSVHIYHNHHWFLF